MNNHDKNGLLDKYIDRVVGQESASIEYASEFQIKKAEYNREGADYLKSYPSFNRLVAEDEEIRVRLKQGLAWSKFMLHVFGQQRFRDPAHTFFTRTSTHRTLFFLLIREAFDQFLYAESRGRKMGQIGVAVEEVESAMVRSECKNIRSIKRIIAEALALNLIRSKVWPEDKRRKMLWLAPEAMETFLTDILSDFGKLADNGLPAARRDLLAAMEANPSFESDIRERLRDALKSDKTNIIVESV